MMASPGLDPRERKVTVKALPFNITPEQIPETVEWEEQDEDPAP